MPGNELAEFFYGMPPFTRWWFSGSIIVSFLVRLGLIDGMRLILLWHEHYKYQLWRPVTAVFFYPITPKTGFHFLMNLYFIYNYSSKLETGKFHGKPAEYFFLLCFSWLLSVVSGYFLEIFFLMDLLVTTIIYIWSQIYGDIVVQFWFGLQFKAKYLPWVLLIFTFVVSGSILTEFLGIMIGHVYYFFTEQYPREHGGQIMLKTPAFFYRLFPSQRTFVGGEAAPARGRNNNSGVPPRFPGRGQTLGD